MLNKEVDVHPGLPRRRCAERCDPRYRGRSSPPPNSAEPAVLGDGSIFQGGRALAQYFSTTRLRLILFFFLACFSPRRKSRADRESRRLFDFLFAGLSLSEGKSLSKAERRRKGLMNDRALIYGEASAVGRVGHCRNTCSS